MRILVTGGAGYIGSHAVRLFLSRGHDVWVYDSLVFGHRGAVPAERLIVADLNEPARLDQVLLEKRIEAVNFAQVALDEPVGRDGGAVADFEAVVDPDVVPAAEEQADRVTADVAGSAGDENAHGSTR